jgi:hypothetical protein
MEASESSQLLHNVANLGAASKVGLLELNLYRIELELIQTYMTQKPLLWVDVGAHVVRNRSECSGVVWAGAGRGDIGLMNIFNEKNEAS